MKCSTCGSDNPENAQFCAGCGAASGATTARRIRRTIKVWLVGGLMGLVTGLSFILVHDALTTDLMFGLWEFAVALATTITPFWVVSVSAGLIAFVAVLNHYYGPFIRRRQRPRNPLDDPEYVRRYWEWIMGQETSATQQDWIHDEKERILGPLDHDTGKVMTIEEFVLRFIDSHGNLKEEGSERPT